MIYISKGLVCSGSTEQLLTIAHGGREFQLTGTQAVLWQNGRYHIAETKTTQEEAALQHLMRMGLAESEAEDLPVTRYRIFSRCILCPAKQTGISIPIVNAREKTMLTWIQRAGLRLSTAELIYLIENDIRPREELLYAENRQALVEVIYTADTIADNILENQMEYAAMRDAAVKGIQSLLQKKKIVLL